MSPLFKEIEVFEELASRFCFGNAGRCIFLNNGEFRKVLQVLPENYQLAGGPAT